MCFLVETILKKHLSSYFLADLQEYKFQLQNDEIFHDCMKIKHIAQLLFLLMLLPFKSYWAHHCYCYHHSDNQIQSRAFELHFQQQLFFN